MCDRIDNIYTLLETLLLRMKESIIASGYIQADETTLKAGWLGHKEGWNSVLSWLSLALYPPPFGKQVLIEYNNRRNRDVSTTFLKGF